MPRRGRTTARTRRCDPVIVRSSRCRATSGHRGGAGSACERERGGGREAAGADHGERPRVAPSPCPCVRVDEPGGGSGAPGSRSCHQRSTSGEAPSTVDRAGIARERRRQRLVVVPAEPGARGVADSSSTRTSASSSARHVRVTVVPRKASPTPSTTVASSALSVADVEPAAASVPGGASDADQSARSAVRTVSSGRNTIRAPTSAAIATPAASARRRRGRRRRGRPSGRTRAPRLRARPPARRARGPTGSRRRATAGGGARSTPRGATTARAWRRAHLLDGGCAHVGQQGRDQIGRLERAAAQHDRGVTQAALRGSHGAVRHRDGQMIGRFSHDQPAVLVDEHDRGHAARSVALHAPGSAVSSRPRFDPTPSRGPNSVGASV